MRKALGILCSLSTAFLSLPSQAFASGFYPLVPTWTLVRGSKTAIRWNDTKRNEKNRAAKRRRASQIDYLRKHGRLNFDDDPDQTSAPLVVPGDLLPLYDPDSEKFEFDSPSSRSPENPFSPQVIIVSESLRST